MDTQIPASAVPISSRNICMGIEDSRRFVVFHPSIWGDYFLAHSSKHMEICSDEEPELPRLKEEVKMQLEVTPDDSLHKLDLIDAIQRLGVGYHFETEIEKSLRNMYDAYNENCNKKDDDLRALALRFRLLRQHGYRISCGVFKKFQDGKGNFEDSLISNVQGLLSLYEAAHYRVQGEEILEEALKFSTFHLESIKGHSREVSDALKTPIHKTLTRLEVKKFLSVYQQDGLHNEALLNFAKLDFNLLQKMHRKELSDITRWWKAFDFGRRFPFARDRVVECYFWTLAVYFEPQYSLARNILTKIISVASVLDDIYDNYGTLDELALLSEAIEKWSFSAADQLPSYMNFFYKCYLNVYAEIEEELGKIGQTYRAYYLIQETKYLAEAYFIEAKWKCEGYIPTLEEYMKVTLVTCGYRMLSTASLVGMGEVVTKEALDWISNDPLLVRASSIICRLMDDMVGQEFEEKITAVECYMNQKGVSKEETHSVFDKQIVNAWKDINGECLDPTAVPMAILVRVVNFARVINLVYKDEDGYSNSKTKLKELVTMILVEPVTMFGST